MNRADDFMKAFFKEYPQAQSGELSMEELNNLIAKYQKKLNSTPLKEFDMLNPDQMNNLLYKPFTSESILQLSKNIADHLANVPIFKLSELLIDEIKNAGKLKLTTIGNIPVRVCKKLYDLNLIKWESMEYNKSIREDEIPYIWPLKQYFLNKGIIKKRFNSLSLTSKANKFLEQPATTRFMDLLDYFTTSFHWSNFYGLEDGGKIGNMGWAYSLVLLAKYGNKPEKSAFYSLKLIQAFEKELWDDYQKWKEGRAVQNYHFAYSRRFFECFAQWFGFVNIERKREYGIYSHEKLIVTRSALFEELFVVEIPSP